MKSSFLYRLEIAPLVILPLDRGSLFSYISRKKVVMGSIVSVPFGKQTVRGVVFDCAPLPGPRPLWMKPIHTVISEAFLTEKQCALAEWISEEYFTPLGKTLTHFLPEKVRARKKTSVVEKKIPIRRLTKEETAAVKACTAKKTAQIYLDAYAFKDSRRLIAELAKTILIKGRQVLVLVPEIVLVAGIEEMFLRLLPKETVAILHSQLAAGPYFEAWERIRSGEATTVIATRQGLFAPFKNLGAIFVLEDQDESYKQWDMSPRYDGRRTAEILALLHKAKLVLAAGAPSVNHFLLRKEGMFFLHTRPVLPSPMKEIEIINLRLERFKKNYSPLSETLVGRIRTTLQKGEQVLLYIHRQGMDAFSLCEHCKNVLRCPDSGHTLTGDGDGGFRCIACGYRSGSFPTCPSCGHLSFRSVGFGTEKVAREAARYFPGARIFRADARTMRTAAGIRAFHSKASSNRIDILIGTQSILKEPYLSKCSLVGMIDADSLLSFPDFRADERLFQLFFRLAQRSLSSPGTIVTQTFHPESAFFQKLAADGDTVLGQLLDERHDLFYPPFSRLIAVSFKGATDEEALKAARAAETALRGLLPARDERYRISQAQLGKRERRKNVREAKIILRIPEGDVLSQEIRKFLKKSGKTAIIDVDPLSI